ncbi:MAG: Rieske (2Fe-2S) protein [Candidatus Nanopelagicales bacterium]
MNNVSPPTRRQVLQTTGVVAAVAAATAGCGFIGTGVQAAPQPTGPVTLGPTSGVPVGGGRIYSDQKVVVTQPSAGSYKAFTAVCTHEGCLVGSVSDGAILCPCHGSQFSISDGSVMQGPATIALATEDITVANNAVILDS